MQSYLIDVRDRSWLFKYRWSKSMSINWSLVCWLPERPRIVLPRSDDTCGSCNSLWMPPCSNWDRKGLSWMNAERACLTLSPFIQSFIHSWGGVAPYYLWSWIGTRIDFHEIFDLSMNMLEYVSNWISNFHSNALSQNNHSMEVRYREQTRA